MNVWMLELKAVVAVYTSEINSSVKCQKIEDMAKECMMLIQLQACEQLMAPWAPESTSSHSIFNWHCLVLTATLLLTKLQTKFQKEYAPMTTLRDVRFPEINTTPFAFENLALVIILWWQPKLPSERRRRWVKMGVEECEATGIISLAQHIRAEQCVCRDD